jgi:mannitol-1-phosphate/altronate dehydrogenase
LRFRQGIGVMRARVVGLGMAVAAAGGLTGCVPGSAGYAGWAEYRQQQANEHAYLSQRNAEAARLQAQRGNHEGARLSQAAAEDQAEQAQQERNHAARDRWLGQFFR